MNAARTQAFAAALAAVDAALDWEALAALYCHDDGAGFFRREQREAIQDTGLHFAADLGEALGALPGGPGRSLYLGAGVAELVPVLFEVVVLEREVQLVNLPGPEPTALDAALAAAEELVGCDLPRFTTAPLDAEDAPPIDHLWLVSVLTDPEAFPALHDELYGRWGTKEAVGGGHPKRERREAHELCLRAATGLRPPALLTTTDEELPLVTRAARELGLELAEPQTARLSGIVGDPVRHCAVRRP